MKLKSLPTINHFQAIGKKYWCSIVWGVLTLVGVVLALISLLGFLNMPTSSIKLWRWMIWGADLSSNFRLQYLIILGALTLVFLIGRKSKQTILMAVFMLLNLALIMPLYTTPQATAVGQNIGQNYSALMLNSGHINNYEKVAATDFIRDTEPDIVVLLEVSNEALRAFQTLHNVYPYQKYHAGLDSYDGVLLFSKYPLVTDAAAKVGTDIGKTQSSFVTQVVLDEQTLTLLAAQTRAPLRPGRTINRRDQMVQLAQFAARQSGPVMLFGDLNTTLWAPAFQEFLQASGLHDGRLGYGLQTSWPTFMPALLTVPIDHVLISPGVTVDSFAKGPNVGSDHYPILVTFTVSSAKDVLAH
jgi:endonuclease/exonuclease/phosphatase (EEP) superfamily protein YafD